MEGQLANEQLGRLLELSDLTESDCACSESVRLLDTFVGYIGGLASCLVRELLSWSLGAGVLAGGLLGACHWSKVVFEFLILKSGRF